MKGKGRGKLFFVSSSSYWLSLFQSCILFVGNVFSTCTNIENFDEDETKQKQFQNNNKEEWEENQVKKTCKLHLSFWNQKLVLHCPTNFERIKINKFCEKVFFRLSGQIGDFRANMKFKSGRENW